MVRKILLPVRRTWVVHTSFLKRLSTRLYKIDAFKSTDVFETRTAAGS